MHKPLLDLARTLFPDLTQAELEILEQFRGVASPARVISAATHPPPTARKHWAKERAIRSELLRWLCLEESAAAQLTSFPLDITGAYCEERVILCWLKIPFPLSFTSCWFPHGLDLTGSEVPKLVLDCCWVGVVNAQRTPDQAAMLNATRIHVHGTVSIRSTRVDGGFDLTGAEIGGDLDCSAATLVNGPHNALSAGAKISGSVLLGTGFTSVGEVRLFGASITGALRCTGGKFQNPQRIALNAEGATIGDGVFLGAGFYDIRSGWRVQSHGWAFEADGGVRFFGARLGSSLICHAGRFHNSSVDVITLELAKVAGSVLFRFGFSAEGLVQLFGAEIEGDIECGSGAIPSADDSHFVNPAGVALSLNRTRVDGFVDLSKGVHVEGWVDISSASIGSDLRLSGVDLSGRSNGSIQVHGTGIKGALNFADVHLGPATRVNFTDSSCTLLDDDLRSWPLDGRMAIDGFAYNRFAFPGSAATRLDWLRRQISRTKIPGRFRAQPYRQAASVLRSQGLEADAGAVLVGMARDRLKWGDLHWWSWLWNALLWLTIGGGFQPIRVIASLIVLWVAGYFVFGAAYQAQVMLPTDKDGDAAYEASGLTPASYEPFCAAIYAVDTSLPVISFGQRDKWHPAVPSAKTIPHTPGMHDPVFGAFCETEFTRGWFPAKSRSTAEALSLFRWAYLAVGWYLTTMLVAGVTGLVGRE